VEVKIIARFVHVFFPQCIQGPPRNYKRIGAKTKYDNKEAYENVDVNITRGGFI